jgi:hypothetical protein
MPDMTINNSSIQRRAFSFEYTGNVDSEPTAMRWEHWMEDVMKFIDGIEPKCLVNVIEHGHVGKHIIIVWYWRVL